MHLTDPVFIHLRLNHFPIMLGIVGAAAAVLAAILRKDGIWRYALITVVIAAATSPVAWWTGTRAVEKAEGFSYIDAEMMDIHEESAEKATVVMVVAGVAAAVALWKPSPLTRWVFLALALAGAGAMAWTGSHGGQIVHASPLLE